MIKNFKLMSSSFLMALTLVAPQLTHAMEPEYKDMLPEDLRGLVVRHAAYKQCLENNTSPTMHKTLGNLALFGSGL